MKTLTSLVLVSLVLFAACVATAPTVKYYHKATGKRLAVRPDRIDLSSLSGGGSASAIITQVVSSGCSSTSTQGILDGNGSFVSLLSNLIPPELTQSGVTAPPRWQCRSASGIRRGNWRVIGPEHSRSAAGGRPGRGAPAGPAAGP